jgi:hypothetical protein
MIELLRSLYKVLFSHFTLAFSLSELASLIWMGCFWTLKTSKFCSYLLRLACYILSMVMYIYLIYTFVVLLLFITPHPWYTPPTNSLSGIPSARMRSWQNTTSHPFHGQSKLSCRDDLVQQPEQSSTKYVCSSYLELLNCL